MASIKLKFDDKKAKKFFESVAKNYKDVTEYRKRWVNAVSVMVVKDVDDHFDEQMGGDNILWREWSDSYLKKLRSIRRQGNSILQYDGTLKRNFRPSSWRVEKGGVVWYNNAKTKSGFPYAAAHDKGGPKLPKRRFMWLSRTAKKNIVDFTLQYVLNTKKGSLNGVNIFL